MVVILFFWKDMYHGITIPLPTDLAILLPKNNFRMSGNTSMWGYLFLSLMYFSCQSLVLAIPFSLKIFHGGN